MYRAPAGERKSFFRGDRAACHDAGAPEHGADLMPMSAACLLVAVDALSDSGRLLGVCTYRREHGLKPLNARPECLTPEPLSTFVMPRFLSQSAYLPPLAF